MSDALENAYAAYLSLEGIPAQAAQEAQREDAAFAKDKQNLAQQRDETARGFESKRLKTRQQQRAEVVALQDRFMKVKTTAGGYGSYPARTATPSGTAPDFENSESLVRHMGTLNAGKAQFNMHLQELRERLEDERNQSSAKRRDAITWIILAVGLVISVAGGSTAVGAGMLALTTVLVTVRFAGEPSALVMRVAQSMPILRHDRRRRGGLSLFIGGIVLAVGGALIGGVSTAIPALQPLPSPLVAGIAIAVGALMIFFGRKRWGGH